MSNDVITKAWDDALAALDLAEQLETLCLDGPQAVSSPATADEASPSALFRRLDRNADGRIDLEELAGLLEGAGRRVEPGQLRELVARITGHAEATSLGPAELAVLLRLDRIADPGQRLEDRFRLLDGDGSGHVSTEELHLCLQALGLATPEERGEIDALITAVDGDADGRVDAEEFRRLFQAAENRQRRCSNTSMPDRDWWGALWPEPADTLLQVGLRPGMAMLDVGCGYGLFTIPAARLVAPSPAVGLDIDAEVLEEGKTLASDLPNCSWVWGDLRQLNQTFATPFDLVFLHSTLHGIEEKADLVRGVHALLAPGGRFAVVNWLPIPREQTIWQGHPRGPKQEVRMGPEATVELVREAVPELRLERTVPLPPFHYGLIFVADAGTTA